MLLNLDLTTSSSVDVDNLVDALCAYVTTLVRKERFLNMSECVQCDVRMISLVCHAKKNVLFFLDIFNLNNIKHFEELFLYV